MRTPSHPQALLLAAALTLSGTVSVWANDHAHAPAPKPAPKPAEKTAEKPAEKKGEDAKGVQLSSPAKGDPQMVDLRSRIQEKMDEIKERREKQEAAPAKARVPASRRLAAAPKPEAHGDAKEGGHAGGGGHELHWSYTGEGGPENWAQIKPEFATCSTGERQSPIDIREGIRVDLEAIKFDYRAGGFRVLNNGHTIQVNLPAGNQLSVMGRSFELLQFHFHRPSEERVNGRAFDMVAHLVHKDMDGKLAVVAVLLQVGDGHDSIQRVWNNLPLEKNLEQNANTTLDPTTLLPKDRSYYTYMGSLTTPPCSEGVLWMVMKSPVSISLEQLNVFAKLYPMNARPIQPAKGRLIKESR